MSNAIKLPQGFDIRSANPIDVRFILTKQEMLNVNDNVMPEKYFTFCTDDNAFYIYEKNTSEISATTGKFRPITDNNSVIFLSDKGLSIKGYKDATQGQMLVKDDTLGLTWTNPVSDASLQQAVQQAQASATQAGTSAATAGNYAGQAIVSAQQAAASAEAVEKKFWYGTIEQYNALETVSTNTIYIILDK